MADPSTMTPEPSFDSVFTGPRSPHQPFVVKASIDFPGYRVWVEIPLSERDEHELRTNQRNAHKFHENVVAPRLACAISDSLDKLERDRHSKGPVTSAPEKPAK
jgi:hypothetical protein